MENIPIQSIWAVLRWLPGAILRRYFTKERLARLIYVDLQPRYESVVIDLGATPNYQIWLQIINLSPFAVELDRASFTFHCVNSTLSSSILEKTVIEPGQISQLFIRGVIPDSHASHIATYYDNDHFSLEGNIEFNCSVTGFAKKIGRLDGIRPKFFGIQLRSAPAEHQS